MQAGVLENKWSDSRSKLSTVWRPGGPIFGHRNALVALGYSAEHYLLSRQQQAKVVWIWAATRRFTLASCYQWARCASCCSGGDTSRKWNSHVCFSRFQDSKATRQDHACTLSGWATTALVLMMSRKAVPQQCFEGGSTPSMRQAFNDAPRWKLRHLTTWCSRSVDLWCRQSKWRGRKDFTQVLQARAYRHARQSLTHEKCSPISLPC